MKQNAELFNEYTNNFSDTTMKMMIDSNDLLREVEIFLKGYYEMTSYNPTTETTETKLVRVGEPKVNDKGLQSLMFWLKTKMTPLVSMGNINEQQYGEYLFRARLNLAGNLMKQRINYGVSLANYTEVIDVIMESFEAFFTSAIGAGHRRSFTKNSSVETKEYVEKEKNKTLGVFG